MWMCEYMIENAYDIFVYGLWFGIIYQKSMSVRW